MEEDEDDDDAVEDLHFGAGDWKRIREFHRKLSNSNVKHLQFIYCVGHLTPVLGRGRRFWVIDYLATYTKLRVLWTE